MRVTNHPLTTWMNRMRLPMQSRLLMPCVNTAGRTMDALKAAGWPPVFVFMYDETWRLLEALFDVTAPLLQAKTPCNSRCHKLGNRP